MTHINPGTDTTINPVVIDDSYRERKRKEQLRVDWVEEVRSRCYSYTEFYGGERVIRFDELEGVIQQVKEERRECYDAHTGAPLHPPTAQKPRPPGLCPHGVEFAGKVQCHSPEACPYQEQSDITSVTVYCGREAAALAVAEAAEESGAPAQVRIDAAIKELERLAAEKDQLKKESKTNEPWMGHAYAASAYMKAIALLQAAEKSGRMK